MGKFVYYAQLASNKNMKNHRNPITINFHNGRNAGIQTINLNDDLFVLFKLYMPD